MPRNITVYRATVYRRYGFPEIEHDRDKFRSKREASAWARSKVQSDRSGPMHTTGLAYKVTRRGGR